MKLIMNSRQEKKIYSIKKQGRSHKQSRIKSPSSSRRVRKYSDKHLDSELDFSNKQIQMGNASDHGFEIKPIIIGAAVIISIVANLWVIFAK